jgi:dihydroneopterin aldolase
LTSSSTTHTQSLHTKKYACKLSIKDLRLWVHLGCSPEERANPQPISITLKLYFTEPPRGAATDKLDDSVCYFKIVELIQILLSDKTFNLVEHLTLTIREAVYKHLESISQGNVTIKVIVNKLSPPVPNLYGGVSFSY